MGGGGRGGPRVSDFYFTNNPNLKQKKIGGEGDMGTGGGGRGRGSRISDFF